MDLANPATLRPTLPWGRWAMGLGLLLFEYLVLSFLFDIQTLARDVGWLSQVGTFATMAMVGLTAVVVLARAPDEATMARLARAVRPLPNVWVWGGVHAASAAALLVCSTQVFGGELGSSGHPRALLALWYAAVAAVALTAFGLALPLRAVGIVLRIAVRPVVVGGGAGVLAWLAGGSMETLWPWLARHALTAAATLLGPLTDQDLELDLNLQFLGMEDFTVEVSELCSGAEGMGLIAVLSTAYIIRFRDRLRWKRAIVVPPIGVAAVYALNIVRIAALVFVGARFSPEVALGGFHSKAGWVLNCGLALALLAWVRRSRWLNREEVPRGGAGENPTAPYLMPLLVSLALALLLGLGTADFDMLYPLRVLGALAALWFSRSALLSWKWSVSAHAVVVGFAVFGAWLLLAQPATPEQQAVLSDGLAALQAPWNVAWVGSRWFGAIVIAPLAEELAFRGFLLRRLVGEEFGTVDARTIAKRPWPVLVSALAFGALHPSFIAGTLAGIAYGAVFVRRGSLVDAIAAHAITNALLVIYTVATGNWGFLA